MSSGCCLRSRALTSTMRTIDVFGHLVTVAMRCLCPQDSLSSEGRLQQSPISNPISKKFQDYCLSGHSPIIFDCQKMHSRPRKLVPRDNGLSALHKQLNNDFEVHTYLQQHQLDLNNTESYAQLLNSLVLGRRSRTKHLLQLRGLKTFEEEAEQTEHQFEFQTIEERTGKEGEITKNLQREITQTKKSLNLLRGDIGFLVSRNQSAKLLGSKISKVKIVAEDQLKRVSMAFSKDKQQIKIRNEMQKKFGKKLKNISSYESSSLSRSKEFYVEGQLTRNYIYNKLYSSQQAAQNGQELSLIQRQKEKIDCVNVAQQLNLLELSSAIQVFSLQNAHKPRNVATLFKEIEAFLAELQLPSQPDRQEVDSAVETILKEYRLLKDTIKGMTEFYNEQLLAKEELTSKMRECQQEEHELFLKFQLEALYNYIISEDQLKAYNEKLKKFAAVVKSYFKILSYLERHEKHEEADNANADKRRYSSFESETNVKYSAYVTQLHKIHQLLASDQISQQLYSFPQASEQYITSFYESLARDVQQWLSLLKMRISQGTYYPVERCVYHKNTAYTQASQFSIPLEVIYNEYNSQNPSKQPQPEPTHTKNDQSPDKAKRIQLLEDVNRDYYKMIKATMKMEKENTRKNYQFQRVFKRAKYASRDDILEEKRFEASFSVLFTKQSSPALTRAFGLQSRNSQHNFTNTFHYSTQSSFKAKKEKVELAKESKFKVRRSIGDAREQKTRLNEKLRQALEYSAI